MRQLTLAMLVLSRRCLIVFIWGSLAPATVETFVSHVCPCPTCCCSTLFFRNIDYLGKFGLPVNCFAL